MTTETEPKFIRVGRVRQVFDIGRTTLYRAAQRGEITIYRRGSMSFVSCEDVRRWITGGESCRPEESGD